MGPARSGLDLGAHGLLMGLMVVVGSMNVGWMLLTTVVLSVERLLPNGVRWARGFGALGVAAGLWLVAAGFPRGRRRPRLASRAWRVKSRTRAGRSGTER